jgi:hypothetical protein
MHVEFLLVKMKAQYEEHSGRTILGDGNGGWNFMLPPTRFHCFGFWILTGRVHVYLTICTINSDMAKTRFGEEHPQRNCYIFQGVPFIAISFPYFLEHLITSVVRIRNEH